MIDVQPTGQACGAFVHGVDFRQPQSVETIAAMRAAWLDHHVLVFREQRLEDEDLERFAACFGPIADDPYIEAMPGKARIAAIHRRADETGRIFADVWHSDWSFQDLPPAGTCLYGVIIPDEGGDTLFSNQHAAWEAMPAGMKARYRDLTALHSARSAYGEDGYYAEDGRKGGMAITTSRTAHDVRGHPLVRRHPESGREGVRGGAYVTGFAGKEPAENKDLTTELYRWQDRPEFVYRHKWEPGMLVLWDNRSVLHKATGGFEGRERLLHRLTIADDPAFHGTAASASTIGGA